VSGDLVIGWATVDLERTAAAWAAGDALPDDPLLGARVRRVATVSDLVLLEPSTEGRLAGALARHGEGPVAVYLRTARAPAELRRAGVVLSAIEPGPFGPQALVVARSRFGPHVVVVFEAGEPDTIGP
jgi:hypothetical protein